MKQILLVNIFFVLIYINIAQSAELELKTGHDTNNTYSFTIADQTQTYITNVIPMNALYCQFDINGNISVNVQNLNKLYHFIQPKVLVDSYLHQFVLSAETINKYNTISIKITPNGNFKNWSGTFTCQYIRQTNFTLNYEGSNKINVKMHELVLIKTVPLFSQLQMVQSEKQHFISVRIDLAAGCTEFEMPHFAIFSDKPEYNKGSFKDKIFKKENEFKNLFCEKNLPFPTSGEIYVLVQNHMKKDGHFFPRISVNLCPTHDNTELINRINMKEKNMTTSITTEYGFLMLALCCMGFLAVRYYKNRKNPQLSYKKLTKDNSDGI